MAFDIFEEDQILLLFNKVFRVCGGKSDFEAVMKLNKIRSRFFSGKSIDPELDLLEMTYIHALDRKEAVDIAAPMHEGIYNSCVMSSLVHIRHMLDREGSDIRSLQLLLSKLIPDTEILRAMLKRKPLVTSLVHNAKTQLGYLKGRNEGLVELVQLLTQNRDILPIACPEAFNKFLGMLGRLITLGSLLPEQV